MPQVAPDTAFTASQVATARPRAANPPGTAGGSPFSALLPADRTVSRDPAPSRNDAATAPARPSAPDSRADAPRRNDRNDRAEADSRDAGRPAARQPDGPHRGTDPGDAGQTAGKADRTDAGANQATDASVEPAADEPSQALQSSDSAMVDAADAEAEAAETSSEQAAAVDTQAMPIAAAAAAIPTAAPPLPAAPEPAAGAADGLTVTDGAAKTAAAPAQEMPIAAALPVDGAQTTPAAVATGTARDTDAAETAGDARVQSPAVAKRAAVVQDAGGTPESRKPPGAGDAGQSPEGTAAAAPEAQPKPDQAAHAAAHQHDHAARGKPARPEAGEATPERPASSDAAPAITVAGTDTAPPPRLDPSSSAAPAGAIQHGTAAPLHAADPRQATRDLPPVPLDGVGVEIAARAMGGKNRFDIRLDPPELGRIDVRLDVDQDGRVTSRLVVERSETLDLLRRDAPQLERALQDAGLKTSDNSLQFSLRDQGFTGRDDQGRPSEVARLRVTDIDAPAIQATSQSYGRLLGQAGGVDIRI